MNARVLVADSDGVMRTLIVRLLNAIGVSDIVEAENGKEALALFDQTAPDLVILDRYMPDRSGLDVVTSIRASGYQVPVIMVTSEARQEVILAAVEAGISACVIKPFEQDTLKEKVERFLPLDQSC